MKGGLAEHLLVVPGGDACHASTGLLAGHWHFNIAAGQRAERRLVVAEGTHKNTTQPLCVD
jgi:hypothetical protein